MNEFTKVDAQGAFETSSVHTENVEVFGPFKLDDRSKTQIKSIADDNTHIRFSDNGNTADLFYRKAGIGINVSPLGSHDDSGRNDNLSFSLSRFSLNDDGAKQYTQDVEVVHDNDLVNRLEQIIKDELSPAPKPHIERPREKTSKFVRNESGIGVHLEYDN